MSNPAEPMEVDEPPTATELKELGNAAYKARNFREALRHYSAAIDADPTVAAFWGNRAQTNIVLGRADAALADADQMCALEPGNVKGFLRAGKALTVMGVRFEVGAFLEPEVEKAAMHPD